MKYLSGQEIHVGDKVIADKSEGIIVCVIDTKQFTDEYSDFWAYLKKGCLVETKEMGLVHYPEADKDLILKNRR
jgi:hypothetical protein